MKWHVFGSVNYNSDYIPAFAENYLGAIDIRILIFLFLFVKNSVDYWVQDLQDVVLQNWSIEFHELLHEFKIAWIGNCRGEAV